MIGTELLVLIVFVFVFVAARLVRVLRSAEIPVQIAGPED